MPLSSPESQEKLLKNVFEITHSPTLLDRRALQSSLRAGENSSAHFWAYGYYSVCVAQLIECDAGHHDPREYGCLSSGFNSRTADVATILAKLQKRWEPRGQRQKEKEYTQQVLKCSPFLLPLFPHPLLSLSEVRWLDSAYFTALFQFCKTELHQSWTVQLVNNLLLEPPLSGSRLLHSVFSPWLPSMAYRQLSFLHNPQASTDSAWPLMDRIPHLTFFLPCSCANTTLWESSPALGRDQQGKLQGMVLHLLQQIWMTGNHISEWNH